MNPRLLLRPRTDVGPVSGNDRGSGFSDARKIFNGVRGTIVSAGHAWRRARCRRAAIRQLAGLDSHSLADIGIDRDSIDRVVDGLLANNGVKPGAGAAIAFSDPGRAENDNAWPADRSGRCA